MLLTRQRNYTHGDCWLFALELSRYTGWECKETWVAQLGDDFIGHHILCVTPQGRQIDATGWCNYKGVEPWDFRGWDVQYWAAKTAMIYPETRDYLSFDVETLLFKLGIPYVTPKGHCVVVQLGVKS